MLVRTLLVISAVAALPMAARPDTCPVAQPHPLTAPQIAMMSGKPAVAESLYRAALAKTPADENLTAGLVGVLLAEKKVEDASATANAALRKNPQSPALLTALAEVQHRQGLPWEEAKTLNAAQAHGVCYAMLHLDLADYFRFTSMYASALEQIRLAHQLDPYDPRILRQWRRTLPPAQRIAELKKYLAGVNGANSNSREARNARVELAVLESREKSASGCHLVAPITKATDIPFTPIMFNANLVRAWGLNVAVNGRKSHLVIDTGASGLLINSSLAKKAGVRQVSPTEIGGIGDNGGQPGYLAMADSIKIGGLEFRNCLVEVSDRREVVGNDGLIGMNVFAPFLVTLDFPWRKLTLAPLPPYPGTAAAPAKLNTEGGEHPGSRSTGGPHDRYIAPEMKDWMQVYRSGHALIIPGVINQKQTGLFLIDTGAQLSVLTPKVAAAVSKVHNDEWSDFHGVDGRVKKIFYAYDVAVRFGNLEQKNARMTVFDLSGVSQGFGTRISGLLGEDTLGVLVVHIDYRDGLMKFEYSPNRGYQHFR